MQNTLSCEVPMLLEITDTLTMPMDVDLTYDILDPCAVSLVFRSPIDNVLWTFGRDLLSSGLDRTSGEGDVRVEPRPEQQVAITLHSHKGDAVLRTRAEWITGFLAWTDRVVPTGSEPLTQALDAQLARLTGTLPSRSSTTGSSFDLRLRAGGMRLTISGELVRAQRDMLKRAARAADRPGNLIVDVTAVAAVDSAGLRFLALLRRQALGRRSGFTLVGLRFQHPRAAQIAHGGPLGRRPKGRPGRGGRRLLLRFNPQAPRGRRSAERIIDQG